MKLLDGVSADATLSPDGTYRYSLMRSWQPSKQSVLWIMLNPSTADADEDDPTIRRCQSFARSWDYGGIIVANLFGLRSTDPRALRKHYDPVGPQNDLVIESLLTDPVIGKVVAAWGVHGSIRNRDAAVIALARRPLYALALTRQGKPKHPLYVKGDAQPLVYRDRVAAGVPEAAEET